MAQVLIKTNDQIINEYFDAMQTEVNPSPSYVDIHRNALNKLFQFHKNKSLTKMKREDIISYLNSLRKPEDIDPLHKWVGTYNLQIGTLIRFFKWLYCPTKAPDQRPKPKIFDNIPKLKRKEISVYRPTDLWTLDDDLLFLKYCPSKRDRCYHAMSRDLSARPSEILGLKIKEIVFKQSGNKQYAEVLVNGKTGTRHLPLFDSLPYVKEWLDQHPQRHNKNAYLICSMARRNVGGRLTRNALLHIYTLQYKEHYFPMLLRNPTVSDEEKEKIIDLLKKPWNLYIRRHSSLTQKSKFLKENVLRQHAGWTPRSNMHQKYIHYFSNESSESILQEYGILPKDNSEVDVLKPKQCPNCNESNRPDQKFCTKCRLVLSIEAFHDTLQEQNEKDQQIAMLGKRVEVLESLVKNPKQLMEMGSLNHYKK